MRKEKSGSSTRIFDLRAVCECLLERAGGLYVGAALPLEVAAVFPRGHAAKFFFAVDVNAKEGIGMCLAALCVLGTLDKAKPQQLLQCFSAVSFLWHCLAN